MGLKIIGNYIRGGKASFGQIVKILKERGKGGKLLQVGPDHFAVMRASDEALTVPERHAALLKSRHAAVRIMHLPPTEILISELGEVREFTLEGKIYEVVLGVQLSPKLRIIARDAGLPIKEGFVIGDTMGNTEDFVRRMRHYTGWKLELLNWDLAEVVGREAADVLQAKGIHRFMTGTKDWTSLYRFYHLNRPDLNEPEPWRSGVEPELVWTAQGSALLGEVKVLLAREKNV